MSQNTPIVSICIPNLNTRPFLDERRLSIDGQSLKDFEVVIVDDGSNDGSREFFHEWARSDRRVRVLDGPRQGLYAGWNACIRQCRGEFVHIATSDDTMPSDFLEKMVSALDSQPSCDLAHCNLLAFGGNSEELNEWWRGFSPFSLSSGEAAKLPHVRVAPLDGLLHLVGQSVYVSITQLLIRRSAFERVGLFDSRWGSVGDFNWNMRAGLVCDTVHVPDTWGGWRIHSAQVTADSAIGSAEHRLKIEQMIDDALYRSQFLDVPASAFLASSKWAHRERNRLKFEKVMMGLLTRKEKILFLLKELFTEPEIVTSCIVDRAAKILGRQHQSGFVQRCVRAFPLRPLVSTTDLTSAQNDANGKHAEAGRVSDE
jgi:glycosyltransferase involved in cell wall biosynthesis